MFAYLFRFFPAGERRLFVGVAVLVTPSTCCNRSDSSVSGAATVCTDMPHCCNKCTAATGCEQSNALRNNAAGCCCTSCPNPTNSKFTVDHFSIGNHYCNCSRVCSGVLVWFTHCSILNKRCMWVSTPIPVDRCQAILSQI